MLSAGILQWGTHRITVLWAIIESGTMAISMQFRRYPQFLDRVSNRDIASTIATPSALIR
eukprot:938703-Pyramimonas_sp.AAC.1